MNDFIQIDEPSAYLDSEQRIAASKVIKRFIMHAKKTAFVVEHDFIMATYLADRVIVYDGQPGVETTARSPQVFLLFYQYYSLISLNFFLTCDIEGIDSWHEHFLTSVEHYFPSRSYQLPSSYQ